MSMTNEEQDVRRMERALSAMNRSGASEEEQLAAALKFSKIAAKYDYSMQSTARKSVLDALEILRRIAGKVPRSAEDSKLREEASKMLKYYEASLPARQGCMSSVAELDVC